MFLVWPLSTAHAVIAQAEPATLLQDALDRERHYRDRWQSWRQLREHPDRPVSLLPRLIAALETASPEYGSTRSMIAYVASFGPAAEPAVAALQRFLGDERICYAVAPALVAIGDVAIPATQATLARRDQPPLARRMAVQVLLALGAESELSAYVDDPDHHVAGFIAASQSLPALPAFSRDGSLSLWLLDEAARPAVVKIMLARRMVDMASAPMLIRLLETFDPVSQVGVLGALLRLDANAAKDLDLTNVVRLTLADEPVVREAALRALVQLRPWRHAVIANVRDALIDPTVLLNQTGLSDLAFGPVEILDDLVHIAADQTVADPIRVAAIEHLAGSLPAIGLPRLLVLLQTADDVIRTPVAIGIGRMSEAVGRSLAWRQAGDLGALAHAVGEVSEVTLAPTTSSEAAVALLSALRVLPAGVLASVPMDALVSLTDSAHNDVAVAAFELLAHAEVIAALPAAEQQQWHDHAPRADAASRAVARLQAASLSDPDALRDALHNPYLVDAALSRLLREADLDDAYVADVTTILAFTGHEAERLLKALQVIGRMPVSASGGRHLRQPLLDLLAHSQRGVVLAACAQVRRWPMDRQAHVPAVLAALEGQEWSPGDMVALIETVAAIGPSGADLGQTMRPLTQHPYREVAKAAVCAIAAEGDRELTRGVIADYQERWARNPDEHADIELYALGHLARTHAPMIADLLEVLRQDADEDRRSSALNGIIAARRHDADTVRAVAVVLADPSPRMRARGVRWLHGLGSAGAPALPELRAAQADGRLEAWAEAMIAELGSH